MIKPDNFNRKKPETQTLLIEFINDLCRDIIQAQIRRIIMIEAKLGVITCDKCGKPMKRDQKTIIIAEGKILDSNDVLDFRGSDVIYACHTICWSGFEN